MDELIIVRWRMTFDEFRRARYWHFRNKVRTSLLLLYGCTLLLLIAFCAFGPKSGFEAVFPLYLLAACVVAVAWVFWMEFDKVRKAGAEVVWWITEKTVKMSRGELVWECLWQDVLSMVETPDGFLLYRDRYRFEWIPRKVFQMESEQSRFQQIASSSAASYRRL